MKLVEAVRLVYKRREAYLYKSAKPARQGVMRDAVNRGAIGFAMYADAGPVCHIGRRGAVFTRDFVHTVLRTQPRILKKLYGVKFMIVTFAQTPPRLRFVNLPK